MKHERIRYSISAVLAIVIVSILLVGIFSTDRSDIGPCTEYKCDVKNFRLSTTIEIDKEGEYFAKVKGNVLRFVTDPLTMYNANQQKMAYAGDSYHFIAQDSHSIYVNGKSSVEMVGLVNFLGDSYDIYNESGEKIAYVTFNFFHTNGKMYDANETLIADYNSNFFFKDFDVRISSNCHLDEVTVLMIFCSYYSDQEADSKSSSNSNTH